MPEVTEKVILRFYNMVFYPYTLLALLRELDRGDA